MSTEPQIDKKALIEGFNRAAASYDKAAFLQQEIADRLIERLDYIKTQPLSILDLGSGTGYCTTKLKEKYPQATLYAVDIAEKMLAYARSKQQGKKGKLQAMKKWFTNVDDNIYYLCADAGQLPLQNNSMDIVISNLSMQWCDDLSRVFNEIQRVLKKEGFVLFTTFGVNTLTEIRHSWNKVSENSHVNSFIDLHDIGDTLIQSGFRDPVMDAENIIIEYSRLTDLFHDLKNLGAQNHLNNRNRGLQGKTQFQAMLKEYECFKLANGKYPATYEVVYGHAWGRDLKLSIHQSDNIIPIKAV